MWQYECSIQTILAIASVVSDLDHHFPFLRSAELLRWHFFAREVVASAPLPVATTSLFAFREMRSRDIHLPCLRDRQIRR